MELELNGYIYLKNKINSKFIDDLLNKINIERKKINNYGFNNKSTNLGNRIGRLHFKINEYYDCLNFIKEDIYKLIKNPVIMGSLTFENGTSQSAHIDSWFFYTKPEKDMIGVWIALEDIDEDSGPLFYYENSHLLETTNPSMFNFTSSNEVGNLLHDDLNKKIKNLKKKSLPMKKGEIFIWKHNLVHGGSEIKNLNKTRNSIVFHIIDEKSDLFTFENYMKYGKNINSDKKIYIKINEKLGWKYQDFECIEYINNECTYSKIYL